MKKLTFMCIASIHVFITPCSSTLSQSSCCNHVQLALRAHREVFGDTVKIVRGKGPTAPFVISVVHSVSSPPHFDIESK